MKDEFVIVPKKLTAENGAKSALLGEFNEKVIIDCDVCDGAGHIHDEVCEECDGAGNYCYIVPVSWATIKAIWDKAIATVGAVELQ